MIPEIPMTQKKSMQVTCMLMKLGMFLRTYSNIIKGINYKAISNDFLGNFKAFK
jgi:hypothetical protein